MVGGIVIDVAEIDEKRVYVDCQDRRYRKDRCAIHVQGAE